MKKKHIMKRLKQVRTYIAAALIGTSIWFEIRLILFGMLDSIWVLAAAGILALADWLIIYLMFGKKSKWGRKFTGRLLGTMLSIVLALSAAGMQFVDSMLGDITNASARRNDISLVVMNDSSLKDVSEINSDYILGFEKKISASGTEHMLEDMKSKVEAEPQQLEFDNLNDMVNGLYSGEADIIVLNESYRDLILEEKESFNDETRVIYSISYSEQQKNISRKIDVSKDPFMIMITGIDTYGDIDTVSRSDVNILAVVNPSTGKVLLVSIPRDYYVPIIAGSKSIAGKSGSMDKLTHSGLFGAECTVRTVENLFDAQINYYVKVNFSGVVDIIDAIGGVTVQSDYAFDDFKVGANELNGEQALSFARNRHAFEDGDRQRGRNQMKVIEGIINKVSGFSMDYDYGKLVETVRGNVEMNFSDQEIKQLIQLQVTKHPSWSVETISVTGSDGNDYSYFYGSDLYVMYPDEASVEAAKERINSVLQGEQ